MTIDGNILDAFESVLDAKTGASGSASENTVGTVSKIGADGTVWVRLAGASTDTPCRTTTVSVKPGDSVTVEVGGGSARVTGNVSSPSTDDETALKAQASADLAIEDAGRARTAAQSAEESAMAALQSADTAATAAADAQTRADTAYESAAQAVEDAHTAGVAASVAQAAADAAGGKVDELENWFYHDTLGAHVLGDSDGYRTDVSSTGMQVVDTSDQQAVVSIGAGIGQFGKSSGFHLALLPTELSLRDPNEQRVAYIEVDPVENISMFHVANAVIVDDLRFGGGDWVWDARQNRNLSLKWMGGSI